MGIDAFLRKSGNSHAKESILRDRLSYDLKLAAAQSDYYLKFYLTDVDHDGFDVIVDDGDTAEKLQIKTVLHDAATSSWPIQKGLLRLRLGLIEKMGFVASPESEGAQGGVTVMELVPEESSIDVQYLYTDVFILTAFALRIFERNHSASKEAADRVFTELFTGTSRDTVSIPKTCFLEAKDPAHLLALMNIHGPRTTSLMHNVILIANHAQPMADPKLDLSAPIDMLRAQVFQEFLSHVTDRERANLTQSGTEASRSSRRLTARSTHSARKHTAV